MEKGNIYEFSLQKKEKKQVESQRKNKKTGETETVISNKTVNVPVYFALKRPNRRMGDLAERRYAVELGREIQAGCITKPMLIKKYSDSGGALSESEASDMLNLMKKVNELESEYKLLNLQKNGNSKRKKEVEEEILSTRKQLLDLEVALQGLYQHTADARAERALLLWYTANLALIKDDDGEWTSYFDGINDDAKIDDVYEKEELQDGVSEKAVEIFMRAVSYWFYNQDATQEAIQKFIDEAD
jgi:hypothetical protein